MVAAFPFLSFWQRMRVVELMSIFWTASQRFRHLLAQLGRKLDPLAPHRSFHSLADPRRPRQQQRPLGRLDRVVAHRFESEFEKCERGAGGCDVGTAAQAPDWLSGQGERVPAAEGDQSGASPRHRRVVHFPASGITTTDWILLHERAQPMIYANGPKNPGKAAQDADLAQHALDAMGGT